MMLASQMLLLLLLEEHNYFVVVYIQEFKNLDDIRNIKINEITNFKNEFIHR